MKGLTLTVPRGWHVLSSSSLGFQEVIQKLARHGWGAGLLLTHDSSNGGFSGFRTQLSKSGCVGTKFEEPPQWFRSVSEDGRTFTFAGSSYRVVICAHAATVAP